MSATLLPQAVRQPFGSVSQARLRNLSNTKNTQNALPVIKEKAGKDVPAKQPLDFDAENVDPTSFKSSIKDQGFTFDTKVKMPQFSLKTWNAPQSANRKRKVDETESSIVQGPKLKRKLDSDAPPIVPIGRSPPRKHAGLLSRRRAGAAYKRIDPPSSTSSIPFSLGAALAGTVPQKAKKVTKKRWEFQIYEDSPSEEMANLMEHSTCTLDISDDENRVSQKGDKDNKENIAPNNYQTRTSTHQSQDLMTEKVRTPLGDLEVKEFYAEGCDATSAFIVPADEEPTPNEKVDDATPTSPTPAVGSLNALIEAEPEVAAPHSTEEQTTLADVHSTGPDFEIWESGSAKAEEEGVDGSLAVCT